MKIRTCTGIGPFFIVLMLLIVSCDQRRAQLPAIPGNPAPPFSLADVTGRTITLADFSEKIVVLDFWATWCGPCKNAMGELEALHRKYGEKRVVILGISVNKEADAAERVRAYAKNRGLTYLLAVDNGSAYKAYGVTRVPATYILDRNHIIRETYPGFRPGIGNEIGLTIEKLLTSPQK